jgi:hypothetical protein
VDTRRAVSWRSPPGRGWLLPASLAAFVFGALSAFDAHAQTIAPWDYPPMLSTTPQQVLPLNPVRRRIIFFNPSATALIAFCPSQVTREGATFACAVHGSGSIMLLPLASFVLDGGTPQGPPLSMGSAWFGVSTSDGVPSTVLEFE